MHNHHQTDPHSTKRLANAAALLLIVGLSLSGCDIQQDRQGQTASDHLTLLNVSYDPTRELYWDLNQAFSRHWEETTGQRVAIRMSHGGSGSQAQAVIDGLQADVVTLALAHDVDLIAARTGLLAADWRTRLPNASVPYTSTVTFLVRKGNPKQIRDWDDLVRPDVRVMTPNPKTSGVARLNYLALWGHALRRELGPDFMDMLQDPAQQEAVLAAREQARAFVTAVYANVPALDWAARCATNSFLKSHIGDVLVNWENENLLSLHGAAQQDLEIVVPPFSVLAEPVVALIDGNVGRDGKREVVEAYLEFLYSEEGQDLVGRHFYRPAASSRAAETYRELFPQLEQFRIEDVFGGWDVVHRTHFAEGGVFDQIDRNDRSRRPAGRGET
ncbi:MAG: sulfate ABC transporter substrate-binding protein [Candidatus Krumholzibacteriia bacterium]